MEIRPLDRSDAASFWALRLRGFREDPRSFGSSYEENADKSSEHAEKLLAREGRSPDDFVLGAFDGEALVGIVGLEREPRKKRGHRAGVWGMYVAKEVRGRGVARALTTALIERARSIAGLERLNLTVMADNAAAIALYESLGFVRWGTEPSAMRNEGVVHDEHSMGLQL